MNRSNDFRANAYNFISNNPLVFVGAGDNLCIVKPMVVYDEAGVVNGCFLRNRQANEQEDFVRMYMLGWQHDQGVFGQLGNAANYFYTGPLNGCTFAVDKNWKQPYVTHVNQNLSNHMNVAGMGAQTQFLHYDNTSKLPWKGIGPNIR